AQGLGATHFHGALVEVGRDEMGGNSCGMQTLEEVVGHGQGFATLAFDLADHGVGTRIDDPVLTSDVVLEDQQDVAIVQGVYVLGLAGVDLFVCAHDSARWKFRLCIRRRAKVACEYTHPVKGPPSGGPGSHPAIRCLAVPEGDHSHSMVAGGLLEISEVTRETPLISLMILLDTFSRNS